MIGKLAVRFRMISEAELQQARLRQGEAMQPVAIGVVLLQMGLLNEWQLNFLLGAQQMKVLRGEDIEFGRVLVAEGFVSEQQVAAALQRQKDHYMKFRKVTRVWEILIASRLLSEEQRLCVESQMRRSNPRDRMEDE